MSDEFRHDLPDECAEEHELLALAAGDDLTGEVQAHVASCDICAERLQQLSSEVVALQGVVAETADWLIDTATHVPVDPEPSDSPPPPAPTSTPVEQVGRYKVVGQIGSGGQADVYRVVHPVLQNVYVLKLSRHATRPGEHDRLVREGKMLAALDHPNLARVIDLDFHEGRAFVVMEYINGQNLRQYMSGRTVAPQQAAGLMAQVASALAPAHASGLMHLDLKPENVVVGSDGRPRVIDFGLAMLRDAWQSDDGDPQYISGTVEYMPPEQAQGHRDQLGPATDVFAMGAMLYELLTGSPPYWGGDSTERWTRAQQCDIDRSALDRAPIPASLRRICRRALECDPRKRYQSVDELARDLQREAQPTLKVATKTALAAATTVVVAMGLAFALWPDDPPSPAPTPNLPAAVAEDLPLQGFLRIEAGERALEPDDFAKSVPTMSGDQFTIAAYAPRGMNAVVFWYTSEGQLVRLATSTSESTWRDHEVQLLTYPADRVQDIELKPPIGTELVFVCASKSQFPPDVDMEILVEELMSESVGPGPLGHLPRRTALQFDNNQPVTRLTGTRSEETVRGPSEPIDRSDDEGSLAVIEQRLETLRTHLDEHFDYYSGVAFPHVAPISVLD